MKIVVTTDPDDWDEFSGPAGVSGCSDEDGVPAVEMGFGGEVYVTATRDEWRLLRAAVDAQFERCGDPPRRGGDGA